MSLNNILRHLVYTVSPRIPKHPRRLLHHFFPSPFSYTRLSVKDQCFSSIFAKISTYSSSSWETPMASPFSSPYLSVCIRCPKDVADMLSEALICFGANSTSVDEQGSGDSSDKICINSIFSEQQDVGMCISHAANSIGLNDMPSYEVKVGEQYDWIEKSQESFNPVQITEGLWIVPEWKTPPDAKAINIILNPGLSFGTGEHPTTKLCLLLLHGLIKGGEHFLDFGTGSGILAIAALKFGAALSVGIDVDPEAITRARHNGVVNNIGSEKMHLHLVPDKTGVVEVQKRSYDVVIANILLNPLLELAEEIVSYAKPGGVVGVSGIISEQAPYIIERYSELLDGISVLEIDDWVCISGTKKINPAHM